MSRKLYKQTEPSRSRDVLDLSWRERSKRRRREDAAVVFVGRGLDVGVGRGLHGGNFAHEFARVRARQARNENRIRDRLESRRVTQGVGE